MPDFTLVTMQECRRLRCDSPAWASQGGCWPYIKSRQNYEHGSCKHMCGWHELTGPESQSDEQRAANKCPRCGGETMTVRVAV